MAISRQKKEEIIGDLHKRFDQARVVVFVQFRGLSVGAVSALRKKMRTIGAEYTVAKKTLARRVMDGMGYAGKPPALEGETAFVFGHEDALAPVREVHRAEKEHRQLLNILGGVFEGEYRGIDTMRALATIPSRETLLGQVVGLSASPLRGTVTVLGGTVRNMLMTLQAIAQSKS